MVGLPAGEVFDKALADGLRLREPAVEENEINRRAVAEEVGEVAGDGGIFRVGKSHFAQAGGGSQRAFTGADWWKESFQKQAVDLGGGDFGAERSREERGSGLGHGDGPGFFGRVFGGEGAFLDVAAEGEELGERGGRQLRAGREFFLEKMGEGEIEVVAAEKKVVAHGDTVQARQGRVGFLLGGKEAEVGRAAADIDDEDVGFCARGGEVGLLQPRVERGLRLLEQDRGFGKARAARGFQGELLRGWVERCRDGDREVLVGQRGVGMNLVPRGGELLEKCGEGLDGAELIVRGNLAGAEREEFRAAVGGVMDEPGFCGMDDAAGDFGRAGAGESPSDPIGAARWQIEKRWERRVGGTRVIGLGLRNRENGAVPLGRFGRHESHGAIRGAEVDADAVAGHLTACGH